MAVVMGGNPRVPVEIVREEMLLELAKRRAAEAVEGGRAEFHDALMYGYALGRIVPPPSGVMLLTETNKRRKTR